MTIADFDWNKVDLKKAAKQLRVDLLDFADEIEKQFEYADDVIAHHSLFEEVDGLMKLIDRKLYSLQYESISELSVKDKGEIADALARIKEILMTISKAATAWDGTLGKLVLGRKQRDFSAWMD